MKYRNKLFRKKTITFIWHTRFPRPAITSSPALIVCNSVQIIYVYLQIRCDCCLCPRKVCIFCSTNRRRGIPWSCHMIQWIFYTFSESSNKNSISWVSNKWLSSELYKHLQVWSFRHRSRPQLHYQSEKLNWEYRHNR